MLIFDRIDISGTKREYTDEGYLKVPATLARTGIYDYAAGDIGMTDRDPATRVKVYRPEDVVFDSESMNSFSLKPVTDGHPPEMVNVNNIKRYQVGNAASEITRDGNYMTTDLLITDADMIKKIESGKVEVSNGYSADFDFISDALETGEHYDAIQKNIRGNHIAIVDKARGGVGCRLSDEQDTELSMKKYTYDGVDIEVTEQAAQVIGKLESKVQEVTDSLAAKDGELAGKTAEWQAKLDAANQKVADAEAKIVTDADLDARAEARGKLIVDAQKLSKDFDCAGKSEAQIIEGVVTSICDGLSLDGYSEDQKAIYCKARFDSALEVRTSDSSDGAERISVKVDDEDIVDSEKKRDEFKSETENAYKVKGA